MNFNFGAVVLAMCLCIGASSAFSFPKIDCDSIQKAVEGVSYKLSSTFRVVKELCFDKNNNLTEQLATDFFNCYDAAPAGGRAIYTKCQIKVNGVDGVMNTTAGIEKTCKGLYTFPLYATCLAVEFNKAKIDLGAAVTDVNKCEELVLNTA